MCRKPSRFAGKEYAPLLSAGAWPRALAPESQGEEERGHGVEVNDDNTHMIETQHAHTSPADRGECVERGLPTGPDLLRAVRVPVA
jgi:hypothetical protein